MQVQNFFISMNIHTTIIIRVNKADIEHKSGRNTVLYTLHALIYLTCETTYEVNSIITILKMRKIRYRKDKYTYPR